MLDLKKSLKDYGVAEGDMVMMDRMRRQAAAPRQAPRQAGAGAGGSWDFSQTPFLPETELPPCARLSSQVNEEDVIKASAKETAALEDKQLAEAIARSASDSSMDTSESNSEKAGTSGTSSNTAAASASSDILPTDLFKEADVANMLAMGFPRAGCITELRKNGGD